MLIYYAIKIKGIVLSVLNSKASVKIKKNKEEEKCH